MSEMTETEFDMGSLTAYEPPTVESIIEAMGPHTEGMYPYDPDSCPTPVLAAVHEIGHVIGRAVCGVPLGAVEIHEDGGGEAHAAEEGTVTISRADRLITVLAGPLAEAELLSAWGDEYRTGVVYAGNAATDLAETPSLESVFDPLAREEAYTRALVWTHWDLILRLARALLDSPARRLEPVELAALIGSECDMVSGSDGRTVHSVDSALQEDSWAYGEAEPGDLLTVVAGYADKL